jgi:glycosyltransferase 2 family protein
MEVKSAPHLEVPPSLSSASVALFRRPPRLVQYLWIILKNIIGYILILGSGAVGISTPGPFGIPLFFIGFALITFPGKRALTARVLKGKPIAPDSRPFRRSVALASLLAPAVCIFYLNWKYRVPGHWTRHNDLWVGVVYFLASLALWLLGLPSVHLINRGLRLVPTIRRRVRPWMRRKGIDLLPPRRRSRRLTRNGPVTRAPDDQIIAITEGGKQSVRGLWARLKPWISRFATLAITAIIFAYIVRPIVRNWDEFRARVWLMRWDRFLLASFMFAAFLFIFRALLWRRILIGFGHRLPIAPATRIWSTSELARYIPGVIWQMAGRVILVRPYGVSSGVCSASQVLELVIFLLANVLVAITCLLWDGFKHLHGPARMWFIIAMLLVPVLLLLLHPRIFYGSANTLLTRLHKPPITSQLGFGLLAGLLLWSVAGLLWQSLAIWVVAAPPLGLEPTKWWVVAGAYCLAWCAGFLAFWAPGGLGMRELVFVTAMSFMLPKPVRAAFHDPAARVGFLAFLSVLLRLWASAGELIVAALAYTFDWKGAAGRADAPGRVEVISSIRPLK